MESLQKLLPPRPVAAEFNIDDPAEILHEQTKFHRLTMSGLAKSVVRYLHHPAYIARGVAGFNHYDASPVITLPAPVLDIGSLADALSLRKSTRQFAPGINLQELSSLLHHAVRVNRYANSNAAPHLKLSFRPYPSPGGLYPTEFYLLINSVEGITPCIAHYDAREHCLRRLQNQDGKAFSQVEVRSGEDGIDAPLMMIITSVPQRATAKYGARGYRMALLEAGHACQNLCLAAQGLGLGSLVYAAYYDDELAQMLHIDGVTETVASVMLIGKETGCV